MRYAPHNHDLPLRSQCCSNVGFKPAALLASAFIASALSASATVIAGWDTWVDLGGDTYNATVLNGATGVAVGTAVTVVGTNTYSGWANWTGATLHNSGASIDGSWGTITDSAPSLGTNSTDAVGLLSKTPSGEMTFTLVNTSGVSLELDGFHFDGVRVRTSSPDAWSVSILAGSAVTLGTVASGTVVSDTSSPFLDRGNYDINLTLLADRTLDNGESVIFQLAWTGGPGGVVAGGNNTMIDNVAITGIAVPEPSTFALGGLGMLLLVACRKRRF